MFNVGTLSHVYYGMPCSLKAQERTVYSVHTDVESLSGPGEDQVANKYSIISCLWQPQKCTKPFLQI